MKNLRKFSKRISLFVTAFVLAGTSLAFFVPSRKANADPACVNGGAYVIFARGTTAPFGSQDETVFRNNIYHTLGVAGVTKIGYNELGNLDNDGDNGLGWSNVDWGEYPAAGALDGYGSSINTGVVELINIMSDYANRCPKDAIVLAGYSQGAQVVGHALLKVDNTILDHIGYAALYGDPEFNRLCSVTRWWEKVTQNNSCFVGGIFGARSPYAPSALSNDRLGSWCDASDGFCHDSVIPGSHMDAYKGNWMAASSQHIANRARDKVNELNQNTQQPQPTPPPNTLTLTQGITRNPSGTLRAYAPFSWSYTVRNTSGSPASIKRLAVAVRGPSGNALDVPCDSGAGVTLAPNQTFTCNAPLPTGLGQAGNYTLWADWLGYDGSWHQGQLGGSLSMTLATPYQMSAVQPVSVGPTNNVTMYTPLQWSYRMRNTSGSPISIQRAVVAVRGPSGNALDVQCANGNGITLQPDEEWTCAATLPTGYGQAGTYTFWADWMDYNGVWHQGQLSPNKTMTLTQAPTLTAVQPISVGPSDYRPMLTPLWWSYRIRNTSGAWASIQRLSVAVRGPAGDALDVQCLNGTGVTLAPGEEWTCDAQLPTGYGSTGRFTFWADWLGYDGSWHAGQLGNAKYLTLY